MTKSFARLAERWHNVIASEGKAEAHAPASSPDRLDRHRRHLGGILESPSRIPHRQDPTWAASSHLLCAGAFFYALSVLRRPIRINYMSH